MYGLYDTAHNTIYLHYVLYMNVASQMLHEVIHYFPLLCQPHSNRTNHGVSYEAKR